VQVHGNVFAFKDWTLNSLVVNTTTTTNELSVTGNLFTDTIHPYTTNGNIIVSGNLIPETSNLYDIGAPEHRWDTIWGRQLDITGVYGQPTKIGCLITISNVLKVLGDVGNNDVFFTITEIPTIWRQAVQLEARMTGISANANFSFVGTLHAGVLNTGNTSNNLQRMFGTTDETSFNIGAPNWAIQLIPDLASNITSNTIQFEAKYNYNPPISAQDTTWKSCVTYYAVEPL